MEKTRSKRLIIPERRKFHVEREKRRGLRRIVDQSNDHLLVDKLQKFKTIEKQQPDSSISEYQ